MGVKSQTTYGLLIGLSPFGTQNITVEDPPAPQNIVHKPELKPNLLLKCLHCISDRFANI